MTEPTGPGAAPPAACDAGILADLAEAFGTARLNALLAGLDDEIARRLVAEPGDPRLGGDAHALVSVSGTLGFTPLSQACAALERACLAGEDPEGRDPAGEVLTDVAERRAAARAEAARARAAIAVLLGRRG